MATMEDVAEKANVSTSTVSHVINGTRYVSPSLRDKVEEAMEELDYSPHAAARSLRAQKTHTIGVVVSDITNPFFAKVVRGVESVADEKEYKVIVANTDETAKKEEQLVESLLAEERVDGLVIAPTGKSNGLFENFKYETPVVFVDRVPRGLEINAVLSENVKGAYELTNYLINNGHDQVGIILGRKHVLTSEERFKGYKKALTEAGIPYDDSLVTRGNFKVNGAFNATKELLSLDVPPTAIFTFNNKTTHGTLKAINQSKYDWPEDVEVAGFDKLECLSFLNLPLVTVVQKPKVLGKKSAERIYEIMENKMEHTKLERVGVELVKRTG